MPSAESSATMLGRQQQQQQHGGTSPELLPSSFLANHHRLSNPNDPKLHATKAARSKRAGLFGGIIESKPKDKSTSKLQKTPSSSGGEGRGSGGHFSDFGPTHGSNDLGVSASASTWTARSNGGGISGMAAPRKRTSSRSRRHSLGPGLTRSAAELRAQAEKQQMPDLPSRFVAQAGQALGQSQSQDPSLAPPPLARTIVHNKTASGDSRLPSDWTPLDDAPLQDHAHGMPMSPPSTAGSGTLAPKETPQRLPLDTLEQQQRTAAAPARADVDQGEPALEAPQGSPRITTRTQSLLKDSGEFRASPLLNGNGVRAFPSSVSTNTVPANGGLQPAAPVAEASSLYPGSRPITNGGDNSGHGALSALVEAGLPSSPLFAGRQDSASLAPPTTPGSSSALLPLGNSQASPSRASGPVSIRTLRASVTPQPTARMTTGKSAITPRRAGGNNGSLGQDAGDNGDEEHEEKEDDDDDLNSRSRRKKVAGLSLMDFLSSEPPGPGAGVSPTPTSSRSPPATVASRDRSLASPSPRAGAPALIPLLAAAMNIHRSSEALQAPMPPNPRRRSSGNTVLPTQRLQQLQSTSPLSSSRRDSATLASTSIVSQGLNGEQGLSKPPPSPSRSQPSFLARLDGPEQRRNSAWSLAEGPVIPPPPPQPSSHSLGKMKQVESDVDARAKQGYSRAIRAFSPRFGPPVDLGSGMSLAVEPMTDDIVMFGSTQTSSNYSLSGAVVLTIPRLKPASPVPGRPSGGASGLSRAASINDPASPTKARQAPAVHRHTASLANPTFSSSRSHPGIAPTGSASRTISPLSKGCSEQDPVGTDLAPMTSSASTASAAVIAEGGSGVNLDKPTGSKEGRHAVKVESLTVAFSGYAMYVDATGRFNAIKLASVSQELLHSGGCVCYADADSDDVAAALSSATVDGGPLPDHPPQLHAHRSKEASQPIRYDIEFDLAVPGWLPGSLRSRFGGTFYCLQATAVVDGRQLKSQSTSPFDRNASNATASGSPLFLDPFANGRFTSDVFGETTSLGESAATASRSAQRSATDPQGGLSSSTNTKTEKPRSSWFGKRAKQLQLRTTPKKASASSSDATGGGERFASRRCNTGKGSHADLLAMEETGFGRARNDVTADGKRTLQSAATSIVIRRCRDVVPVPVARMALISSDHNLPGLAIPSLAASAPSSPRPMTATSTTTAANAAPEAALPDATETGGPEAGLVQSQSHDTFVTAVGGLTPSSSVATVPNANNAGAAPHASSLAPAAAIGPRASAPAAHSHLAATPASGRDDDGVIGNGSSAVRSATLADPVADVAHPGGTTGSPGPPRTRGDDDATFPPAPSAFDLPSDPAKRAAAAAAMAGPMPLLSSASTASRTAVVPPSPGGLPRSATAASVSSDVGNTRSPPRTSSRAASSSRSSAPMRHFLHRPVLYPPAEFGIFGEGSGAEGLPFSLTLSLPSHVQVSGPKSDTLSFGVQIEVSTSDGWNMVRQLGGLRLRDMELVCLQTERHSSVPSRTFCTTFPVPAPPNKVPPTEIPHVAPSSKRAAQLASMPGSEARLRLGYDRDLVLNHLALLRKGTAPDPLENNVERTRTTIVGPPPVPPPPPPGEAAEAASGTTGGRQGRDSRGFGRRPNGGKAKDKSRDKSRDKGKGRDARADSSSNDANNHKDDNARRANSRSVGSSSAGASGQGAAAASSSVASSTAPRSQPSSSSLRARYAPGNLDGSLALHLPPQDRQPLSMSGSPRSSRPALPAFGPTTYSATAAAPDGAGGQPTLRTSAGPAEVQTANAGADVDPHRSRSSNGGDVAAAERSDAPGSRNQRGPSRGRRAYANAISRLSTFASSMLDPSLDASPAGEGAEAGRGGGAGVQGSSHRMGDQRMSEDVNSRATYVFSGEDGDGVDLTRGRVRMTISLPLALSNASAARAKGSAQLIPDFESPYVRIRHKLKVKLGFGLSHRSTLEEHHWSQALVMCVPVRFTESPPKEVQDQFAPITVQPLQPSSSRAAASSDPTGLVRPFGSPATLSAAFVPMSSAPSDGATALNGGVPLLPAYTQLFREDGSRLADEGEDLPQYPGRMTVVGEIDVDERDNATARLRPVAPSPLLASAFSVGTIPEDGIFGGNGGEEAEEAEGRGADLARQPSSSRFGHPRELLQRKDIGQTSASTNPPLLIPSSDAADAATSASASAANTSTNGLTASFSYASMFAEALERGGPSAVPTPMDRSTSLPGRRGLVRGAASLSPLKSSVSNTLLGPHSAIGDGFVVTRPPMRQRSATSASVVTFSRIAPSEVLDEALLTNVMEDEEARRDAARVDADGLDDDEDDEEDADGEREVDALSMGGALTDAETSDAQPRLSSSSGGGGDGSSEQHPAFGGIDAMRGEGPVVQGYSDGGVEDDDEDDVGDTTIRLVDATA